MTTNDEKELDEILRAYKKSLSNWVSRANNDLPPSNQKGRIIQEIDHEAKQQLLAWRDDAVRSAEKQARANAYYEAADVHQYDPSAYSYWMEKRRFQLEGLQATLKEDGEAS